MILNISNNTDIIRFYEPWLIERFKNGFFSIETQKQNNVYELTPKNFELLVFQTKDPTNIIKDIDWFDNNKFKYFFIITLTPYDKDVEPSLDKTQVFEKTNELSNICGSERIVWKYAPIIINSEYSLDFHIKKFEALCKKMNGITKYCICDFIDPYEPPVHASLYAPPVKKEDKKEVLNNFKRIAGKYGIEIYSKNLKKNVLSLLTLEIEKQCGISIENTPPILDMGLKNTCRGECEYCFCGGNKLIGKNTNCIIDSPVMIGCVDKSKKHTKRKCIPLT